MYPGSAVYVDDHLFYKLEQEPRIHYERAIDPGARHGVYIDDESMDYVPGPEDENSLVTEAEPPTIPETPKSKPLTKKAPTKPKKKPKG